MKRNIVCAAFLLFAFASASRADLSETDIKSVNPKNVKSCKDARTGVPCV